VTPDVTVVVPTRNRSTLLQLTLRTILGQRGVDLEVVVVDDGSSEDVGAAVAALADPRVRLIRHERATGVSTARNDGAAVARGEWLAFCDDDDLWAPHKLAAQLAAAAEGRCPWAYGGAVRIDPEHRILGGTPPPRPEELVERLPRWNPMPGGSSNVIVRAELLREAGAWDPGLVNLADWDLWIRLARLAPPACAPEPLVAYRVHSGNTSGDTTLVLREAQLLDGRYGHPIDYGDVHHYLAWVSLRSGRRRGCAVHLARAAWHGQVRASGRSAVFLLESRLNRLFGRPPRPHPVTAWWQQADAWLAVYREAS
jgi:glycosyltransferase involved in cell wall biosynthesis